MWPFQKSQRSHRARSSSQRSRGNGFHKELRLSLEALEPRQMLSINTLPDNVGHDLAAAVTAYQNFRAAAGPTDTFTPAAGSDFKYSGNAIFAEMRGQGNLNSYLTALAPYGVQPITTWASPLIVDGYIPLDEVQAVAGLTQTQSILPVYQNNLTDQQGSKPNQADPTLRADLARRLFGTNGSGVTVGVISDSGNAVSGGIAASQTNGDLPPGNRAVDLLEYGGGTDEGRAMMEQIYDIAPGVNLKFASGGSTDAQFATAVNTLVAAGCQIIVDDLNGLYVEPYLQDGLAATAVNNAIAGGVSYFSSAGNRGTSGYEAPFHAMTTTVATITGTWDDFSGGSNNPFQTVNVAAGTTTFVFQYDDPFYGGSVTRNVDFYVLNSAGNAVLASGTDNNLTAGGTGVPREIVDVTVGSATTVKLAIRETVAPTDITRIKYIAFNAPTVVDQLTAPGALNDATNPGHNSAANAVTVAAADAATPKTFESFTAQGPTTRVFDAAGNRLGSLTVLNKPDLTSNDGISTSVPGFNPFYGTSSATPNAAALGALLKGFKPSLTPAQIKSALTSTAVDINTAGYDLRTGYGLADVTAAMLSVNGGNLAVTGDYDSANENDAFVLKVDSGNSSLLDVTVNGNLVGNVARSTVTSLYVNGLGGNNTLTVDFSNGNPIPSGGLIFDGGNGAAGNLVLQGGNFANESFSASGAHSGNIVLTGGTTGTAAISYLNLKPITDTNAAANFTITATAAAETINIIDGPGGTTQVNSANGTFELVNFANKANVVVHGNGGADTFNINNPNPGTGLANLTVTDGTATGVTFNVQKTPASVVTNVVGNAAAAVNVTNANSVQGILGLVNITNPAGNLNVITVDDSADTLPRIANLATFNTTWGRIQGLSPANINYQYANTASLTIYGGNGGNTFNVQATGLNVPTTVNSGNGSDTINVASDAPTNQGNLGNIAGNLLLNTGNGVDTLNVFDLSGPGGRTYNLANAAGATRLSVFPGVSGTITYDANGTTGQLENFNLTGSKLGSNVYNVALTSATATNTITDGNASNPGNSTFNIQADALAGLGATNTFNGEGKLNTFNLNYTANGNTSATGTLTINAGPTGNAANRNVVNAYTYLDNAARTLGFNYPAANGGKLNVTGLGALGGIQITAAQEFNLASTLTSDLATVTGPGGNCVLSVTPTAPNWADVFLNGAPETTTPTSSSNNPGQQGGGGAPDLFLSGLAQANGLSVNGGDGSFNQLVVNAPTEDSGNLGNTSGWGGSGMNAGSSGPFLPSTISTVRTTGNAYDTITANETAITIRNNASGNLVQTNILGGFANPASPSPIPAVTINAGDEAGVQGNGTADDITVTLSAKYHFLVNGGNPLLPSTPPLVGDALHVVTPAEVNIYSDTASPPHVSVTSGGSQPLTWTSIEKTLLTPGSASMTVNIIGDNNGANAGQNDNIAVIGGNTDNIPATGGVNKFWVVMNGAAPIGVDNTKFLNVDTQGSTAPGNNTVTIKPYADNTPEGWDVAANVTSSTVGSSNVLNYGSIVPSLIDPKPAGGIAGVSENITVTPTPTAAPAVGAGQISVPNVATINFTNFQDLNFYTNDGSAGDSDSLTIGGSAQGDYDILSQASAGNSAFPWASIGLGATSQTPHLFNIDQFLKATPANAAAANMTAPTTGNLASVHFALGDGNDTLAVDSSLGPTTVPVIYDGGTGSNKLVLSGNTATSDVYAPGPGTGAGLSTLTFAGGVESVQFSNLMPVIDSVAGNLTVNGTNAADSINYTADPANAGYGLVSVNNLETISFLNKTSLTINGQAGGDTINLNNPGTPTGLANIVVNGNDPTLSDTLIVNGTAAADAITANVTGTGAGTVQVNALPAIRFTTVGNLTINGQGGNDALSVITPAATTLTLTPGAAVDAGSLQVGSLLPLAYTNLGAAGNLTANTAAGTRSDTLVYNGTAASDVFNVANGTGTITLNSQIAVLTPGVANLALLGQLGADTFNVNPGPFAAILLDGGDAATADAANLTGNGAAITVNLGNTTPSITGGGLGNVNLTGVAFANVTNGTGNIAVSGTPLADTFNVTPTGANMATVQVNGVAPVLNANTSGTLTVGDTAPNGNDAVTINGTSGNDTINVVRGAITDTVQVVGLKQINVTSAGFNALAVASGLGTDTVNANGTGGPALTILGGQSPASDTLNIANTLAGNTTVTPGATNDSGVVLTPDGTVNFAGQRRVNIAGNATAATDVLNINGTNGGDALFVGNNVATVNSQAAIGFTNFNVLNVNGLQGADQFNVSPLSVTLIGANQAINVNGSAGAAGVLTVNGSTAQNVIGFNPTGPAAGNVTLTGAAPVVFGNVPAVVINGQGGNDALTTNTPAGSTVTLTPGMAVDAGSVQVGSLAALSYLNLGAGGNLSIATTNASRSDTLVVNGTTASDVFNVAGTSGNVTLNSQIGVLTPGVNNLTLLGVTGGDVFNVTAPSPYANITLDGGDAAAADTANLTGNGTTVSANLGNTAPTVTGAGLGNVNLVDVAYVNLNAGGGNVALKGTSGDDAATITPSGANAGTAQLNGLSPIVNYSAAGNLAVDLGAGNDALTINGGPTNDVITANAAAVTVAGKLPVGYSNVELLAINGLAGNDTLIVDSTSGPVTTPIAYDGGGSGSDKLQLTGGTATADIYTPGPGTGAGTSQLTFAGGNEAISFKNLSPVIDLVAGPLTVNGTNNADTINYGVDPANANNGLISINNLETISFLNKTNVAINTLAGQDTINVDNTSNGLNGNLNIDGGDPQSGDTLIVNGNATATLTVNTAAANVSGGGPAAINYGNIEGITVVGGNANAALAITGAAAYTVTPGAASDAGTVLANNFPITFSNIDSTKSVTLTGNSATATLTVNGTASNDVLGVANTGNVTQQGRATIVRGNLATLTLNGLGGENSFTVAAGNPYTTINVNGSGLADPDTLTLNGNGAAIVTANLWGNNAAQFAGAGLGTVNVSGVGAVSLNNVGNAAQIVDSGLNNTLDVTPLGANLARTSIVGQVPVITTNTSGNLSVAAAAPANNIQLVVEGSQSNDTIGVDGGNQVVSITSSAAGTLQPVSYANVASLTVNGNDGNDAFSVITGNTPIFVDGGNPVGTPGDTFSLNAGNNAVTFSPGPTSDAGGFQVGNNAPVSFQHIEKAGTVINAAAVTVNGTNGDDDITVIARDGSYLANVTGLDGNQDFTVSVNSGLEFLYVNVGNLTLNGLSGDDDIAVQAPAPNGVAWNATVFVNGNAPATGSGALGDSFALDTPASASVPAQTVTYAPNGPNSGNLTDTTANATIVLSGLERATYNGGARADNLFVAGTGGNDTFTSTPGATRDAGMLQVNNLLALNYQNLGNPAAVNVSDTGANNALVVNGTPANDLVAVTGNTTTLNTQLPLASVGVQSLTLNGLAGDNHFVITAAIGYTSTSVNGSGLSDPDVLDLTGNGAALTASLGSTTPTISGGGLGTVSVSGVGLVNLAAAGGNVSVLGTAGDDAASVTPSGPNAGNISVNSAVPVLNYTGAGRFSVDLLAGNNTLIVNGGANDDAILATPTKVTVDSLLPVNYANLTALAINGLAGNDTLTVDSGNGPVTTPIVYDGGTGSNTLDLAGGTAALDTYMPGPNAGQSTSVLNFANGTETVQAVNLAPVVDTVAGLFVVQGVAGDNITYTADANLAGFGRISVGALEPISFQNKTDVFLDAAGQSVVTIDNTSNGFSGNLFATGDRLANDTLDVTGGAATLTINVAGQVVTGGGPAQIFYANFQSIGALAGTGVPAISIVNAQNYVFTPAAASNASTVLADNFPINISGLGSAQQLSLTGLTPSASLTVNGTAANDQFTVAAGGSITLNADATIVDGGNLATLTLNGLAGDNGYAVTANQPYTTIHVNGSGLSDPDVLTLNGNGAAAATGNLAGNGTAVFSGAGLGSVTVSGVGTVNLNNLGSTLQINDLGVQNTLVVAPTGLNTAQVSVQGQVPAVNTNSSGNLVVVAAAAANDDQLVVQGTQYNDVIGVDGANQVVSITSAVLGTLQPVHYVNVSSLTVNGNDGNDTFNVQSGALPIFVDGGNPVGVPGDVFSLNAANNAVTFSPGPTSDSGGFQVGTNASVSFQHIEKAGVISNANGVTVNGTNGDDDITIIARDSSYAANVTGLDGNQDFTVSVDSGLEFLYVNVGNLTVNALSGDDDIVVQEPAPNGVAWNVGMTINGNAPATNGSTLGDTVALETPAGGNITPHTLVYSPSGPNSGNLVDSTANATLVLNDAERLFYNGGSHADSVTVAGTGGNDTFTSTPGATRDAGTLQVNSLLALNYQNLGNPLAVNVADSGTNNTLVVNGTAANDLFTVTGNTTTLNAQIPLATLGVQNLTLNGLAGDNRFTITANVGYTNTSVNGSGLSDPDVLNLAGNGTAVTASMGNATPTFSGGGLGTVSVSGVALVNLTAGAGNINVQGTAGDDAATVTPSGNGGNITVNTTVPTLNYATTGSFNVDLGAGNNILTVMGSAGNDAIKANATAVQVNTALAVNYANTTALAIDGLANNDTLTVDSTPGPVTTPIVYDGGTGSNKLVLTGGTATSDVYAPGPGTGAGLSTLTFAGGVESVQFLNLMPVIDNVSGNLTVLGTNAADAINYSADPGNTAYGLVSVNNLETISFLNKTSLTINGLAGADAFNLNNPTTPTGLANIVVNGNDPTLTDTLVVNGTSGGDVIAANVTATGNGTVLVDALPTIRFTAMGNLTINGQGGGDALSVITPAATPLTLTPGATVDAGSLQVGSLLPLAYTNLGAGGNLTLTTVAATRSDTLVYNGTAASDVFSLSAAGAGSITLNNQIPVLTPGMNNVVLEGLDGDDQFFVPGNMPYPLTVDGGNPTASDTLNFIRTTGDVSVNLDSLPANNTLVQQVSQTAGNAVTLQGIEIANLLMGGAGNLTVLGTRNQDVFTYTPTSASTGSVTAAGINTLFNFTGLPQGTSNFTITGGSPAAFGNAGGMFDKVVVNGMNGRDLIQLDETTRKVVVRPLSVTDVPTVLDTWHDVTLSGNAAAGIIQSVQLNGANGDNTFQVVPGNTTGNGLAVNVVGNTSQVGDALVIAAAFDAGGNATVLPVADFVAIEKSLTPNTGAVLTYASSVRLPTITYQNVQTISPNVSSPAGVPNTISIGPDAFEPDESLPNAAFVGAGSALQIQNGAILPAGFQFPGVPADQDYYRFVAQTTGTLDFQVYFRTLTGLVPGNGNLVANAYDVNNTLLGSSATGTFGSSGSIGNARVRIPVVAGQTYYLQVVGSNGNVVNGYNATILNTAPPVPFDLQLSRSVPAGTSGTPDTGDTPTTAVNSDSGRSQFDNVTNANLPTIYLRVNDGILLNDLPGNGNSVPMPFGNITIPFQGPGATPAPGYRVAIFDGNNAQTPLGFATQVAGYPGLYQYTFAAPLADGVHHIEASVQMVDPQGPTHLTGLGNIATASLDITVDTVAPPVFFGNSTSATDGLAAGSDSGVASDPATYTDRVTNDTLPAFWGTAEANSIIRVYALTKTGAQLLLGQTTAVPIDGTNATGNLAYPGGMWNVTSNIDLNNTTYFNHDGTRTILVTAEDLAGNVSPAQMLTIFIDTQGPQVANVQIGAEPFSGSSAAQSYNLFGLKGVNGASQGPTPLVHSIVITLQDAPIRDLTNFALYPALDGGVVGGSSTGVPGSLPETFNVNPGLFSLVGDANGNITIEQAIVTNFAPTTGNLASATITLVFDHPASAGDINPQDYHPLPDDRYTLTLSDQLTDPAGNKLDGESNASQPSGAPSFPSGNNIPGGNFVARFTVDSRPEIGTVDAGSVYVDINGNGIYDPNNTDAANRDLAFTFGFTSDDVIAGNFGQYAVVGASMGYDTLAAYGEVNGVFRWAMGNNAGVQVGSIPMPANLQINGQPFEGDFDGSGYDQLAILDANGNVHIDINHNFTFSLVFSTAYKGQPISGYPVAGDFTGRSGETGDIAVWTQDHFSFAFEPATGWVPNTTVVFSPSYDKTFGFIGERERPVAADMNGDGITDLGLFVPDRADASTQAEWYWLISTTPAPDDTSPLKYFDHTFTPTPLGSDLYTRFGNEYSVPIVGNFDPPPSVGDSSPTTTTTAPTTTPSIFSTGLYDSSTGTFHLEETAGGVSAEVSFGFGPGTPNLVPLTGDWDGTGTKGVGLYDPASSTFYLSSQLNTGYAEYTFAMGVPNSGEIPLVGDWNGDGKDTVGLYDPKSSSFYLVNTLAANAPVTSFGYGVAGGGWKPLVGDWDGNGTAGVGLYDPHTSNFMLTNNLSTGSAQLTFGYGVPNAGWTPLVGDWDGNGSTGVGLYDPKSSTFMLTNNLSTGTAQITFGYGVAGGGWTPLVGDWDGNGTAGVGLYDPKGSVFYLSNHLVTGYADVTFQLGPAGNGWVPFVGANISKVSHLFAANSIVAAADTPSLADADLASITTAAIERWAAAGASPGALAVMADANFVVTDLGNGELGRTVGNTVYLDRQAAGHGWFIDPTPNADEEFVSTAVANQLQAIAPQAIDRIDLLTVVEHELGHVAGLDDNAAASSIMDGALASGVRRNPSAAEVDAIFGQE